MNDTFTDLTASTPFHVKHWPRAIVHPIEHDGGERLSLMWDLGVVDEKVKKQAINEWCLALPDLRQVRWLKVWSLVTPALFEALCRMPNLECLQIKMSNVSDIGAIANLKQLRYLHIGSSTKVQSIEPLAALSQLRLLELENFKLVSDFSPLLALEKLESLAVTGSLWTKQTVESLDPFVRMTGLTSLSVDTSGVPSLKPFAQMVSLKELGIGGCMPMHEYAWLSAKLPNTECRWFRPYLDLATAGIGRCPTCANDSMVMITGKGGPSLCKICDSAKVQRHEEVFYLVQKNARN